MKEYIRVEIHYIVCENIDITDYMKKNLPKQYNYIFKN